MDIKQLTAVTTDMPVARPLSINLLSRAVLRTPQLWFVFIALAAALWPSMAQAAGYPKPKLSNYEYRVECEAAPNSGTCSWVPTPSQAADQWLSTIPPFVSTYRWNCNGGGPLCIGSCSASWQLTGYAPFLNGGSATGISFRLNGTVANDDIDTCVAATQQTTLTLYRRLSGQCPTGFVENPQNTTECICPSGTAYFEPTDSCKIFRDRYYYDDNDSCKAGPGYGKPIFPTTGSERMEQELLRFGQARVDLSYDTRRKVASNKPGTSVTQTKSPSFASVWESNIHKALIFNADGDPSVVHAWRGMGRIVSFTSSGAVFNANTGVRDRLAAISNGWQYTDPQNAIQEIYDSTGRITSLYHAGGGGLNFVYSDAGTPPAVAPVAGLLIEVRDLSDRSLQIAYELPAGGGSARVTKLTAPGSLQTTFSYDGAGNLGRIGWPDQTGRVYVYENSAVPWALTGIVDEAGLRTHTIAYDAGGRAFDSQAAGGVDRYVVSWATPPSWSVTETLDAGTGVVWRDHYWSAPQGTSVQLPNGQVLGMGTAGVQGMSRVTSMSQPAGSGCNASSSTTSYDANGNIASRDDFNGHRVCHASDGARNLELVRVEGLAAGTACSVTASGAALPRGSRKVSTQWHPDWSLRTRVAEPGRITTSIYNGQPSPFTGIVVSCAPADALLPDGKPIVVLCRQVEQATTDANGSLGFSATVQAGVAARERQWSYDRQGRVLSETDPLGHTTSYAYYQNTAFSGQDPNAAGHTLGDLSSVTSPPAAAGKPALVTSFTSYDKAGNWLQRVDPNGVMTTRTFDARQRLSSQTVAGQTTAYAYWPTGLLRQVTQPDGSWVAYSYDAAHRLTGISDNLGNSVIYTLDAMGNRTAEQFKDPAGVLRLQLARSLDALGRVQQVTGRESAP